MNGIVGGLLTWPLAAMVGKWSQRTQGGVPRIPYQHFKHDFIDLDPALYARKRFRFFFAATVLTGGLLFAFATTD